MSSISRPIGAGVEQPAAEQRALAQAYALLQRGSLPAAEAACRAVLARSPTSAAAVHLLGLIVKERGDAAEGESLLRRSVELEPSSAEYRANLGNLLRRLGRLDEAEGCYRAALSLDAAHSPARMGLARTLNDLGQHAAAEGECRRVLAARPADPVAWSALAMTLRDQQRAAEAEEAYRRAIAVTPGYGPAHHNLASLLIAADRTEEAMVELDLAEAAGVSGFEVTFTRAQALTQLYRLEEAERAFEVAAALRPTDVDAQVNLARLRYMRDDPQFARTLAAAAANARDHLPLQMLYGNVLRRSGDLAGSEALLRDVAARHGPIPEIRSALATVLQEAGRLEEAEREALEAAAARPNDMTIIENLVSVMLSRGRAADARPFVAAQRLRAPRDQRWITYEAMIARLLGEASYRMLFDYRRLVRSYDLRPPSGWSSIEALNAAVAESLAARHRFARHPFDQSLRNGSQTARNLTADPDPAIQTLVRAFMEAVAQYRAELGTDAHHPLSARNRGQAHIRDCWSVQLRRGGHHVNHIHPEGWISSAYYVAVPKEVDDANLRSGWLKFGEPRFPVPGAHAELFVPPSPGKLVLFPSYMWHGTNAIHGDEPRLTVAFDVITDA